MLLTLGAQKHYINIYLCLRRVPDVGVSCLLLHDSTHRSQGTKQSCSGFKITQGNYKENVMEKKKWINTSRRLEPFRKMPPLKNWVDGQPYDPADSEVIKWICNQPDIVQYIFEVVNGRSNNREALIKYDSSNGTWVGIDYGDKHD